MYSVSRRTSRCFSSIIRTSVPRAESVMPLYGSDTSSTSDEAPSTKSAREAPTPSRLARASRSARAMIRSYSTRSCESRSRIAFRTSASGRPENSMLR